MKNEKSSGRGSNAEHEKRDSQGRFESSNDNRGGSHSHSSNSSSHSGQKRDSEGRFESNRGRKSEK
ncbi:MAG: hypothetical protein LUF87_11315 [Alistipes sp.]|nr:hypothetical protein [Alistipes sp.]